MSRGSPPSISDNCRLSAIRWTKAVLPLALVHRNVPSGSRGAVKTASFLTGWYPANAPVEASAKFQHKTRWNTEIVLDSTESGHNVIRLGSANRNPVGDIDIESAACGHRKLSCAIRTDDILSYNAGQDMRKRGHPIVAPISEFRSKQEEELIRLHSRDRRVAVIAADLPVAPRKRLKL
jgi:hypothetical protein